MIKNSIQDKQDEIFRKMPISKKLRLTLEFSAFLLNLNKLNKNNKNDLRKTAQKISK